MNRDGGRRPRVWSEWVVIALATLFIEFSVGGYDLVSDLFGALLLVWLLPGIEMPRPLRLVLQPAALGMLVLNGLSLLGGHRQLILLLSDWRLGQPAGPGDALPAAAGKAFELSFVLGKWALVAGLMLLYAWSARVAGRHAQARLARWASIAAIVWGALALLSVFTWIEAPRALLGLLQVGPWVLGVGWMIVAAIGSPWLQGRHRPPGSWRGPLAASAVAVALLVATALGTWGSGREIDVAFEPDKFALAPFDEQDEIGRRWKRRAELHPNDPVVLTNAALVARLTRGSADAEALYWRVHRLRPFDPKPLSDLGDVHLTSAETARDEGERRRLAGKALAVLDESRRLHGLHHGAGDSILLAMARAAWLLGDHARLRPLADELVAWRGFQDDAQFYGHQYRGLVALHDGDLPAARAALLAAGKYGRRSPVLASFGPELPLAQALLDRGERQTVAAFLLDLEIIWKYHAAKVRSWREAIERGESPRLTRR